MRTLTVRVQRYKEQQKFFYAVFGNMEKKKELLPIKVSF
jgi:hypothetical protein